MATFHTFALVAAGNRSLTTTLKPQPFSRYSRRWTAAMQFRPKRPRQEGVFRLKVMEEKKALRMIARLMQITLSGPLSRCSSRVQRPSLSSCSATSRASLISRHQCPPGHTQPRRQLCQLHQVAVAGNSIQASCHESASKTPSFANSRHLLQHKYLSCVGLSTPTHSSGQR